MADFKRAVDEGFDDALAEVTAALEAVPVAMTLPGLESVTPSARGDDPEPPLPPIPEPNPLQERLNLRGDDDGDDAINYFAPDPSVDWGPHWPRLGRHDDESDS